MIRRITLGVGLAAGYVLGTKAGRQRYDQIVGSVRSLARRPEVAELTSELAHKAGAFGDLAKTSASEAMSSVSEKVGSHRANDVFTS